MSATERLRSVLITGSSTGIGAATALELDRQGFRVFAGVRSAADAERLRQSASRRLTPILLDVTDEEQVIARAADVSQAVGDEGLAGLVNNAGIVVAGPLELLPMAELRRQFEVNVLGMLAVTQAFLPLLRAGRGRIVNVTSGNGFLSLAYFGSYSASKFAQHALSDALRQELRHWGIPVSMVAPGCVATPIWGKSFDAAERLARQVSPERYEQYHEDLDAVRAAARHLAETAGPVERVAKAVCRALVARRPKALYIVGFDSRLLRMASRFLPIGLRDRIVIRALGLKRR